MKRVIVIGAGVAGLAAAARLQHAGYEVTLFEKEPLVGGKMNQIREEGFTFDVGPTIVMMPELYLEQLARPLVQAGLLRSVRGKGGGYALAQEPAAIRAGDVLRAVEGSTAPVACLDLQEGMACPRAGECTTVRFWAGLDEVIERYVDGVTLADLAGEPGLPSLPAI